MNCKCCGKEIKTSFSSRRVFCSKECSKKFYSLKGRVNTKCQICGNPLTGMQKAYCSAECRRKAKTKYENEYHKDQYKKPKAEVREAPKKRGSPKKRLSIADINKLAKEKGLNYGQYVAKYGL